MRSVDNMPALEDIAKACDYSSSRVDIDAAGPARAASGSGARWR
ncbi:hypothetical protein [Thioalkalivibrio sp. ALJT]|nr:hypothetical protein [Thioalkalivibrio sp. ALJT]